MAYNEFAYFYDELNSEADYDALYRYISGELQAHGIPSGILADLGCGTGRDVASPQSTRHRRCAELDARDHKRVLPREWPADPSLE